VGLLNIKKMKTKERVQTWQANMKTFKLQHIERTAPGFYAASGGSNMATKPYTEKSDYKLAAAISDCIRFCGGSSEVIYNFILTKGRFGVEPVFDQGWKPVRVEAKYSGKCLVVEVNIRCKPIAKSTDAELFLRTNDFEFFSNWFCSHFSNTAWAQLVNSCPGKSAENLSRA
jgi:hypothetical protein